MLLRHSWIDSFFLWASKGVPLSRTKVPFKRAFVHAQRWHRAVVRLHVLHISASLRRAHTHTTHTRRWDGEEEEEEDAYRKAACGKRQPVGRSIVRRKLSLCVESLWRIIASQYLDGGPGSLTIWPTSMFLPARRFASERTYTRVNSRLRIQVRSSFYGAVRPMRARWSYWNASEAFTGDPARFPWIL